LVDGALDIFPEPIRVNHRDVAMTRAKDQLVILDGNA
jgi:hypothetical protein